ncbi:uncharacterized protein IL334_002409 [Kwoniella shivajii]|uniref:Uncharacterized protein n=1 Tax=Kwoniella shivajii TaxID=564305 RepID=A0ABZ1CXR1_9TREE|nr:hypothetical protein IL334_002409 [Kwoniella shivajii]
MLEGSTPIQPALPSEEDLSPSTEKDTTISDTVVLNVYDNVGYKKNHKRVYDEPKRINAKLGIPNSWRNYSISLSSKGHDVQIVSYLPEPNSGINTYHLTSDNPSQIIGRYNFSLESNDGMTEAVSQMLTPVTSRSTSPAISLENEASEIQSTGKHSDEGKAAEMQTVKPPSTGRGDNITEIETILTQPARTLEEQMESLALGLWMK